MFQSQVVTVMHQRKWTHLALALGLVISMALPGCVVVPDQGHYVGGVVMVAPPPPRVEVIGVAPAGHVWVGGYWGWVGGRHEWVPGRWEPARRGHHWVEHAWIRQGDGWRMRPGRWERD